MKHELKVTLFLIALFAVAQLVGLVLLKAALVEVVDEQGNRVVVFDEEKIGEVPQMSGLWFIVYIAFGVGVGTILVLLLLKYKKSNWWRAWFFLAVFVAIQYALKTFLPDILATIIAACLAVWKIYRPNVIVHNLSEVLMYSGIAVFLVPLLNSMNNDNVAGIPGNIFWASLLLVAISVYDFIAVFKSKHMISMAQFQAESKVFAGLLIPYTAKAAQQPALEKSLSTKAAAEKRAKMKKELKLPDLPVEQERKTAILGGGDIAFPLIFSGTVMYHLANSMAIQAAFNLTMIIVATTTAAIALLFFYAKKDKFYPAMPIVSAGCFAGYFIVWLL